MIGRVAVEQYKQNDFILINDIDVQSRIKDLIWA
jgi:N6-L-threonylcarbamoyladenine synthase